MAQSGHDDRVQQCPLSGAEAKPVYGNREAVEKLGPKTPCRENGDNIGPYCNSGSGSSIRWIAPFRSWARR
jgi:hypothetical protein